MHTNVYKLTRGMFSRCEISATMFAILLQAGPIIANMLGVATRVLNSLSKIECCVKGCEELFIMHSNHVTAYSFSPPFCCRAQYAV